MVARKRKPLATKNVNEIDCETIASSKPLKASTAKAQKIVTDLDATVRERCEEMRQAGEDAAVQIRNEYSIQLMLIKKDVRKMTLRDFRRTYTAQIDETLLKRVDRCLQMTCRNGSDDISEVEAPATIAAAGPLCGTAMRITRQRRAAAPVATTVPVTRRATRSRAMETPAPGAHATAIAVGTARPARRGEMLVSQTGSPVEVEASRAGPPDVSGMVPGTVVRPVEGSSTAAAGDGYATMFVQKRRGGKTKATQGGPGILVTLKDGCQVVVTNREALKMVPPEMQAEVKAQLQQWHTTTATLLQASPPAAANRK